MDRQLLLYVLDFRCFLSVYAWIFLSYEGTHLDEQRRQDSTVFLDAASRCDSVKR
jgi:hypothetical protein